MRLIRHPEETNEDFLFHIYNDIGCRDLKIVANQYIERIGPDNKPFTETVWSRRYSFGELLDVRPSLWLKGTYLLSEKRPFTRNEFIALATHRTILDIEVMLDIDDKDHPTIDFSNIDEKALFIALDLRKKGYDISVYHTGNRSYHISYLDKSLRDMTFSQRKAHRERILKHYGADLALTTERKTISLEGARHYKSGKKKKEVLF